MDLLNKCLLYTAICVLYAGGVSPGCVEVESDTEAVVDGTMRIRCISCKRRGETTASTIAEWFFKPRKNETFYKIYEYGHPDTDISFGAFENRIIWRGTNKTADLQEASILLTNITFDDAGTYKCYFNRTFAFKRGEGEFCFFTQINKTIELTVVPKANRKLASIIGHIMMYFLNVVLTLWLFAEMLYCYKKIAAARDEALQENASDYLAITGSKEDCAGVHVGE